MKLFSNNKGIVIPEMTRGEAMACKPLKNRDITENRKDDGLVMLSYPCV